jgi:hypothetical protein
MYNQAASVEPFALDNLFPVDKPPAPLSERVLRWQLRHRTENGLAPCCRKIGKRIFISRPLYEQWLASQEAA